MKISLPSVLMDLPAYMYWQVSHLLPLHLDAVKVLSCLFMMNFAFVISCFLLKISVWSVTFFHDSQVYNCILQMRVYIYLHGNILDSFTHFYSSIDGLMCLCIDAFVYKLTDNKVWSNLFNKYIYIQKNTSLIFLCRQRPVMATRLDLFHLLNWA